MKTISFLPVIFFLATVNNLQAQDVLKLTAGAAMTVQNGATLYAGGGINLDQGSSISNAGIVMVARTGGGTADFTDNTAASYFYGTGKFVFTGSGAQMVRSINQFETIEVSNTGLNLLSDIRSNTWYLKSGKVNTGLFIAVASSPSTTAVQADAANTNFANSWFNGSLRRFITPATVNNYQFPVGDATKVNMAIIDNLTTAPLSGVTNITASFGLKPGNDIGLNVTESGTAYTSVNNGGVWYLVPDANPVSGKYDIKLFFNGFTGLADNSFGILRRPDASSLAADWGVPAGSALPPVGSPGRTVAGGYAGRNNISTFSQFGIGVTLAPLPLQLLSFTAVKKDKNVFLQWVTANEINTSHFELFRGDQPASLQYLDKTTANGFTSGNSTYTYLDRQPLSGANYYRLKMVDKDSKYTWSQVVKVNFDGLSSFTIYPNPVLHNEFIIQYSGNTLNNIHLISSDGRQIACSFITLNPGEVKVLFQPVLAKGTYIVQANTDKGTRSAMIVIQ